MQRKLARRGYTPEEVDAALARLDELGYLNDLSFAEGLVGVGPAQADRALASYDEAMQLVSAMRVIERTYGKREITDYREMLDRVGNKLLRLGFSTTIVRGACRAVMAGTPADAEA